MTSADVIKLLQANGFALVSMKGSHPKYRNEAGVTTIVPHAKKDLPKRTVKAMKKRAGL